MLFVRDVYVLDLMLKYKYININVVSTQMFLKAFAFPSATCLAKNTFRLKWLYYFL